MELTNINIDLSKADGKLKATADVVMDNCLKIRGIKIIEGTNGLFVAMPTKKSKSGNFRDVVHPTDNVFRKKIEEQVLVAYQEELQLQNRPKLIYFQRPSGQSKFLYHFLHLEGTQFTINWDDDNNFHLINKPVNIALLISADSTTIDIQTSADNPEQIDPTGATTMAIIKVDDNHPLLLMFHRLRQTLEQEQKIGRELTTQIEKLELTIV